MERHVPQGAHVHAAGRNGEVGFQQADVPAVQGLLHKLQRHTGHPQADPGQGYQKAPGGELDFRRQGDTALQKVLLQKHPAAGLALQQDQGNSAISCRVYTWSKSQS